MAISSLIKFFDVLLNKLNNISVVETEDISILLICPKCKRPVKLYIACEFCGTYKNKEVLKIKLNKAERKKRAQDEKEQKKKDRHRRKKTKK